MVISGHSRDYNSFGCVIILCNGRFNDRVEGSSDLRSLNDSDHLSVFLQSRLYISIILNGISWDIHLSGGVRLGVFDSKNNFISILGSSSCSNIVRLSFYKSIQTGILRNNSLVNRSGDLFGHDLWLCNYSFSYDFRLSRDSLSDYSWFELDCFNLSNFSLFSVFSPLRGLGMLMT